MRPDFIVNSSKKRKATLEAKKAAVFEAKVQASETRTPAEAKA